MEPFVWKEAEGTEEPSVYVLESWTKLDPELSAGFTSRHGGVSEAPYGTLNCGLHVQDAPEHVVTNRRRLASAAGVPFETATYAEQVHGTHVAVVGDAELGAGRSDRETALPDTDALITNRVGVSLNLMYADCVPLYFYDPVRKVIGLAHAGWKGTVGNIAQATVRRMTDIYGCKPEHVRAAIGPSIGSCCYEVDEAVAAKVRPLLDTLETTEEDRARILSPGREIGKYQLGLQSLNRLLMTKAGILSVHIEVTMLCTGCSTDRFFSHRKEGGRTGRMVAWIARRPEGMNKQGERAQ
ncbi:peptidoglycan editing factor PgeF [Paenibacillus chartarius]|uniref:Purine nucleoside phosphorylase n=1 Tax=Paenibacillus chartarius TaxID=747481 RepID=A0ABV6DNE1_9BACL